VKSCFSHSVEALKRISGSSATDIDIANYAAKKFEEFVDAQATVIDDYTDLKTILTTESEVEIKNALTSMRHVTAALTELASFHEHHPAVTAFEAPQHRAHKKLEEARRKAESLLTLIEH